jgi:hypothetical protein
MLGCVDVLCWGILLGHFLDTFLVPKCVFVFRHAIENYRDLLWVFLCKTAQIGTFSNCSEQVQ